MKASENHFLHFLSNRQQFIVPVYQRPYSWQPEQCQRLWDDLVRVATRPEIPAHFLGSVVYIQDGTFSASVVPRLLIIDGQQRVTTITLMLHALAQALAGCDEGGVTAEGVEAGYLSNAGVPVDQQPKLVLGEHDRDTLLRLLDGGPTPEQPARRVLDNHQFFVEKIESGELSLKQVFEGLSKLMMVDISLDRSHDDPQLIFESLNSTGLDLSAADLIRNFILMGLESEEQAKLWRNYWMPLDKILVGEDGSYHEFDGFMRDFLSLETGDLVKKRDIYEVFKRWFVEGQWTVQPVLESLLQQARYYERIALGREKDGELREQFERLQEIDVDVAHPLLMRILSFMDAGMMDRDGVHSSIEAIESFVIRRAVCEASSRGLGSLFLRYATELDEDRPAEDLAAMMLAGTRAKRLPDDEEFARELRHRQIYGFRRLKYMLERMENFGAKERVAVENYQIEHVLPQGKNLPDDWRRMLGDDWQEIQEDWVHTLGNLTLTGYNPELSNRPFLEKREMKGGFATSPVRLNEDLRRLERWGREEILARADRLAELACEVWPLPETEDDLLERHKESGAGSEGEVEYSLDDLRKLRGEVRELYDILAPQLFDLGPDVTVVVRKYWANFHPTASDWRAVARLVPQIGKIKVVLSVPFCDLEDTPTGFVDPSAKGRHWTERTVVTLTRRDQIPAIVAAARTAYERLLATG